MKQGYAAEKKTPVPQHLEEYGMLPCSADHRDAQVRHFFRKVKHLSAVRVHRRCCFTRIESPRLHFTDVCDQLRLDAP